MNVASIDIGSNTVLLLIAEINTNTGELTSLLNKYEIPRLGKGLGESGNISDEKIDELFQVLRNYKKYISDYKCEEIICTATNAMRIANNSTEICRKIYDELGISIDIISGEREAELSFKGASSVIPEVNEKIVLDIGGGSTEIIYGKDLELKFRKSFPVGAVNLTEKYLISSHPSASEKNNLSESLNTTFEELNELFITQLPLIAVAGTPTSLAAIVNNLDSYDENIIEGYRLRDDQLGELESGFSRLTPEEILREYGQILKGREDVILAGTLILRHILKVTKNNYCIVSGKGIRYGSVVDFIERKIKAE